MKNYKVLVNLPYGLKKNDIVVVVAGYNDKCERISDKKIFPYNVEEKDFFSEIEAMMFNENEPVFLNTAIKATSISFNLTIPAYTKLDFIKNEKLKYSNKITVKYNNRQYVFQIKNNQKLLSLNDPNSFYYFINSCGQIHKEFVGRFKDKDKERKEFNNYFFTHTEAKIKLNKIKNL